PILSFPFDLVPRQYIIARFAPPTLAEMLAMAATNEPDRPSPSPTAPKSNPSQPAPVEATLDFRSETPIQTPNITVSCPGAVQRPKATSSSGPASAEVPAEWPVIPGYEMVAKLGEGATGIAFKARQLHLDRVVALKVIRKESLAQPETLRRFQREARAAAR